jgi:serine/threonine-protein kinase
MSTADSLVGQVIGDRYHVRSLLGEGGMGRVYLAEHVKMGRKSALKVLSPELKFSAEAISRFHREAANASRINHPNVAAIYDFGETAEGILYLAMEFVEGETLRGVLSREPRLDVMRSARLIKQAADALAAAHHLGIVHRDLKPDNIMIARNIDGTDLVKVVDFGIAKTIDERNGSQTVTTAGVSIGTPEYMSPEQLAGEKLDARTDVYSLALVLFHLLTGTLPYPRLTSRETLVKRLTSPARKLRDVAPDIDWPIELQRALDRALAPYVEDRYSSVNEFGLDVLAAALSMHNTRGARLQSADGSSDGVRAEDSTEGSTGPTSRTPRRARPLLGSMVVIMALAALLIRAEPIGRESRHPGHSGTTAVAASDSTSHAGAQIPDSASQAPNEPAPPAAQPALTSDTTVAQAGTPLKPIEHDSLKRAPDDSLKTIAPPHDSAKAAAHDSLKPGARDSVKTVAHTDSTRRAVRDSIAPPTHDSTKTSARDSTKTSTRDSSKTTRRDAPKVQRHDSASTKPIDTRQPSRTQAVTVTAPAASDSAPIVLRPHRLLQGDGDTAATAAPTTKEDSTRAAVEDIRGHFAKARRLLQDGNSAEAQLEFRDAAAELRVLRGRLDPVGVRELDQEIRHMRQQAYDACVTARDKSADSVASTRYQCERILVRPALGRQTRTGQP